MYLTFSSNLKSIDQISIYLKASVSPAINEKIFFISNALTLVFNKNLNF